MSAEVRIETHEQFVKRMDIERSELGRALRDVKLKRAERIARYIANEVYSRETRSKDSPK